MAMSYGSKQLEQKVYELQKENRRLIQTYDEQLQKLEDIRKSDLSKIDQLKKENSLLRKELMGMPVSADIEALLNRHYASDTDEEQGDASFHEDQSSQESSTINVNDESNVKDTSYRDLLEQRDKLHIELTAMEEQRNHLLEEEKVLKVQCMEAKANMESLIQECNEKQEICSIYLEQATEANLERTKWNDSMTLFFQNSLSWAYLPKKDALFGYRWELSLRALPDAVMEFLMPITALNANAEDLIPLPLMFLPWSGREDGIVFRLFLRRKFSQMTHSTLEPAEVELLLQVFNYAESGVESSSFGIFSSRITQPTELHMVAFHKKCTLDTFSCKLPNFSLCKDDPMSVMKLPEIYFCSENGWLMSMK